MNRERLEQVIRVMHDIEIDVFNGMKRFNMDQWCVSECDDYGESCGTAYCAVGWCMLDPWFNKEGLLADDSGYCPEFKSCNGWDAVENFFDLTEFEARILFNVDAYAHPSPMEVARRVRDFINQ